jgi:hypothetical protein
VNLMVAISFYSGEGNRNTCIKQTTRSPQARTLLNKGFTEVKLKSSLAQLLLNLMRKIPGNAYDTWNIFVVICDIEIQ